MKSTVKKFEEFTKDRLQLVFQDLGASYEQILYAKSNNEEIVIARLIPLLQKIILETSRYGIRFADQVRWRPHLNNLNLKKTSKLRRDVKRLHPSLTSEFNNIEFSCELVEWHTIMFDEWPEKRRKLLRNNR